MKELSSRSQEKTIFNIGCSTVEHARVDKLCSLPPPNKACQDRLLFSMLPIREGKLQVDLYLVVPGLYATLNTQASYLTKVNKGVAVVGSITL